MITGWEFDNKNYMITNGKIAAKVTNTISTLFSQGPQFNENHIIEFKVTIYTMSFYLHFFSSYVTFFLRFNLSIIVFRSSTRRRR